MGQTIISNSSYEDALTGGKKMEGLPWSNTFEKHLFRQHLSNTSLNYGSPSEPLMGSANELCDSPRKGEDI